MTDPIYPPQGFIELPFAITILVGYTVENKDPFEMHTPISPNSLDFWAGQPNSY